MVAPRPFEFTLPLVSVVIVNFNYGRYLGEAVRSVFEQRYRRIECIVLDNASTDDSPAVLQELQQRYPDLKVVHRAANDGQSVASSEGFEATEGAYVVFLDADDVMLPDFLAVHIFVHLSLRVPVGFTCSDMFQTSGSDLVLGTFGALNRFIRGTGSAADTAAMRKVTLDQSMLDLDALIPIEGSAVHLFGAERREWPWASMSAFVFRRDALRFVLPNPDLRKLSSNFDIYLARGVNGIAGSAIIDATLTVYRMHRSNVFARHPQLSGVANYERGGPHDHERMARRLLIDHHFTHLEARFRKLEWRDDFLRLCRLLNDLQPRLMSADAPRRTHLQQRFLEALPRLRALLPSGQLALWALKLHLSPHHLLRR